MRTHTDEMIMILSLEHIHPELADIKCEVAYESYAGSTEGFTSDDPSEVHIVKITCLEDFKTSDGTIELKKGQSIEVDGELEDQILEAI